MHATSPHHDDQGARPAKAAPGKYLTFRLGGELYGVFSARRDVC